jgi:hypothetical protein
METHNTLVEIQSDIVKFGNKKFIIVTGGIGDFLTIDYFFLYTYKKNIIFISKQSLKLRNLLNFYKKKNNKFYSLYYDFSLINRPGFNNSIELTNVLPFLKNINIVNISEHFPLIRKIIKTKNINNNLIKDNFIINNNLIKDIRQKFNIPEIFAIIHPYTEDNRINCINCNFIHTETHQCDLTRNFIDTDYVNIFKFLNKKNITGVIISIQPVYLKESFENNNIINLSLSKLDIVDCIELVKQCTYFFGVDSFFSVIASKILHHNNIYVKCNNKHAHIYKDIYWYPNKNINLQSFITP